MERLYHNSQKNNSLDNVRSFVFFTLAQHSKNVKFVKQKDAKSTKKPSA